MNDKYRVSAIVFGGLLLGTTILTGCNSASLVATTKEVGKNNPDSLYREIGNWPLPSQYQGNPFASGGIGTAYTFVYSGLVQYVRSTDKVYDRIAQSIENPSSNETIVHLRHDVKWNDGQPFTSKDVWAYYILNNGTGLTHYLTAIQTPDPYTVVFKWTNPSPIDQLKELLLSGSQQDTIPYHFYKKWVDSASAILAEAKVDHNPKDQGKMAFGLDITSKLQAKLNSNWQEFQKHGPKYPLGSGAYEVKSVTANEMILVPNPYYYDLQNLHFKKIELKAIPDLNQQYGLLRAGGLDRADSTPPQDILESILGANRNLVHYQMLGTGSTGFMFNVAHKPLDNQKFRQAVVYALDRNKIRQVANYYGLTTDPSAAGMSQSFVSKWVPSGILSQFTKFTYDPSRATVLLKSIGWTKGKDGNWKDENGKTHILMIAAPNNNAWFVNSGQVVSEQLTKFGLPTKFEAVDPSVYYGNVNNGSGKYDMSIDFMDVSWSFTFPWFSMSNAYWDSSWKEAHIPDNGNGQAKWISKGYDGKTVNVSQLLNQIPYMQNASERKHAIGEIAYVTNQTAWSVNLFQNVTGTWYNMKTIGGVPWQQGIAKYDRDMPLPPASEVERIAETNEGFATDQWLIDGSYYPN